MERIHELQLQIKTLEFNEQMLREQQRNRGSNHLQSNQAGIPSRQREGAAPAWPTESGWDYKMGGRPNLEGGSNHYQPLSDPLGETSPYLSNRFR